MFCNKCGEILRDNARSCPVCGASQKGNPSKINDPCDCGTNKRVSFQANRPKTHSSYRPQPARGSGLRGEPSVGQFAELIKEFFRRSFDFRGRSSRWEFWWTYLFIFLSVLLFGSLSLLYLWFPVILVPFTALGVRRLHDIGRSGWWLFLKAIPLVGIVFLVVLFCMPSDTPNRWGA